MENTGQKLQMQTFSTEIKRQQRESQAQKKQQKKKSVYQPKKMLYILNDFHTK